MVGAPPPLEFDPPAFIEDEKNHEFEEKYFFSTRIKNIGEVLGWNRSSRSDFIQNTDFWKEICADCNVTGDVIPRERVNELYKLFDYYFSKLKAAFFFFICKMYLFIYLLGNPDRWR